MKTGNWVVAITPLGRIVGRVTAVGQYWDFYTVALAACEEIDGKFPATASFESDQLNSITKEQADALISQWRERHERDRTP